MVADRLGARRPKTVCVLDEYHLLAGVNNWVHDAVADFNLVFITDRMSTLLNSMYFPTDVVYFTVAGKQPGRVLESHIQQLTRHGAKVIVLPEHELPDTVRRAKAAGAAGVIGAGRNYRSIIDLTRQLLGIPKAVPSSLSLREREAALTWEETEVLRLQRAGVPPLLMGRDLNLNYAQVQKVLDSAHAKQVHARTVASSQR